MATLPCTCVRFSTVSGSRTRVNTRVPGWLARAGLGHVLTGGHCHCWPGDHPSPRCRGREASPRSHDDLQQPQANDLEGPQHSQCCPRSKTMGGCRTTLSLAPLMFPCPFSSPPRLLCSISISDQSPSQRPPIALRKPPSCEALRRQAGGDLPGRAAAEARIYPGSYTLTWSGGSGNTPAPLRVRGRRALSVFTHVSSTSRTRETRGNPREQKTPTASSAVPKCYHPCTLDPRWLFPPAPQGPAEGLPPTALGDPRGRGTVGGRELQFPAPERP